ncbi:MAG: TerB family tellurite resistance protein, partial [Alloprevotella sp.]
MSLGTWLGGAVGFFAFGPLGALAGAVLGHFAEQMFSGAELSPDNDNAWEAEAEQRHYSEAEQRSGFLFSLLVLAAYIVQADGRIMHSEMETVRRFLRANFGAEGEREGEEILRRLFDLRKQNAPQVYERYVADSCRQMAMSLSYEQRLQLLAFLV